MENNSRRFLGIVVMGLLLFQAGCVAPSDVRAIGEGQFISFVNAIVNTATSDALRAVIGT